MGVTDDPNDPRLHHGVDAEPGQHDVYLVLSEEERAKGFVRPYRESYLHVKCGAVTRMGIALSETYARDPAFYGATYCALVHAFHESCNGYLHSPIAIRLSAAQRPSASG